jgi:uncharacterized protein YcbX
VSSIVAALHVYPVKGCRGLSLDTARVERRGLAHDRRWMLVDDDGEFVTQRTEPRLARIEVAVEGESLILSTDGHGARRVARPPLDGPRRRVRVWDDEVDAIDAGTDVAAWLGGVLETETSLVFMPETTSRPVRPKYGHPDDVVSFADGFPLLFTTTSSLDDLNARLREPLPMSRFRPNIVVEGTAPWAEDGWTRLRVGELEVRVVKACDRCAVTTIDQLTGARGVEPLRTLAAFRERDKKVYFGVNAIPNATGTIRVGDAVAVPD